MNAEMKKRIYLDNAATTAVDIDILERAIKYFSIDYGNPSGIYKESRVAKNAIDIARDAVARLINSSPDEIYFSGGGSESDNWALRALLEKSEKKHIITSKIEHQAILNTCKYLEFKGYNITYLDVDNKGFVDLDMLEKVINEDTLLVSIMSANNEVGTIQDIKRACDISHKNGAYFHTDAVQSIGKMDIDVQDIGVDMLSISAHKIHAFKSVGALYVSKNINISPLIYGGEQESGKRAGTQNVPGIVSLGLACEKVNKNYEQRQYIRKLRDYFITQVQNNISDVIVTGDMEQRLINNVHFCFKNIDSNLLITLLDMEGTSCSIGSACMSGSIEKSHVLSAMKIDDNYISGNVRFSLSKNNTTEEIDKVVQQLIKIVKKLRK
ncbi:cysteine desulfurase [[Eubacterium] yurii]|nr:cysteine desulfurase [[Eubacterium] yurii]